MAVTTQTIERANIIADEFYYYIGNIIAHLINQRTIFKFPSQIIFLD